MKITQYMNAEKIIVGADGSGIRERWKYGLRILRDPEVISQSGASLRHGAAEKLIKAAEDRGMEVSAQEIQRRLRCARAYPTEFKSVTP